MMYIMLDVEANGPIPGDYSMFWFGAVVVEPSLKRRFEGKMRPLDNSTARDGKDNNRGYKLSGVTHEEVLRWPRANDTLILFNLWLEQQKSELHDDRLMLISDNNGYDAMWINWYFYHFSSSSPFGHSSTNLGSLYKGLVRDTFKSFKYLRRTKHTHNPVDDALGNAEALLHMKDEMGLRIKL